MESTIKLFAEAKTQDAYGIWRSEMTSREVFCTVRSVTRAEFYDGGRNGLNPQYSFVVFVGDYSGELLCEYEGKTYSIYRTYIADSDYIELYAERKGGSNGKEESQAH